ncbi:MAG: hypothetical protein V4438_03550 [Patescibacteria group bacterium]
MKNLNIDKYLLSFILIFSLFQISSAATLFPGYQPLTPVPGIQPGPVDTNKTDLSTYLGSLYKFGVAAAAGLAVIMVIWGGIEYITAVAGEGKSGGKERITSAILGLLLALGSYIILNTINPDLLSLKFTLGDANIDMKNQAQGQTNTTKLNDGSTVTSNPGGGVTIDGKPVNMGGGF